MRHVQLKRFGPSTKVGQVCDGIRRSALKHGPGAKLPTSRELCAAYDVSQVTLNEALNTLESQNVIVRKDRSGIFVSEKIASKAIRIMLDTSLIESAGRSPFWGILWGLIAREAQVRAKCKNEDIRFEMVSVGLHRDVPVPDETLDLMDAGMVHGILGFGMRALGADSATYSGLPLVGFGGSGHWQVIIDIDAMFPLLVPELAAAGCGRIGFWAQPPNPDEDLSMFHRDNLAAFSRALADSGLPFCECLASKCDPGDRSWKGSFQQFGFRLAMEFFDRPPAEWPDGVVITDDMVTAGAIVAFNNLGIRIGKDVAIATHANTGSSVLFGYEDVLIRAEFDALTIVHTMFDLLDVLMEGRNPEEHLVPVRPVLRRPL
jgi:DNA-binding LacI/PurR family transcriptional regulator